MQDDITIKSMQKHSVTDHGVVDMGKVVKDLKRSKIKPFNALYGVVEDRRQSSWHAAALDGMRALASQGECSRNEAKLLLDVSTDLENELGSDQITKSINAVVGSKKSAPALIDFLHEVIYKDDGSAENRWLAFHIVATIIEHQTTRIPSTLLSSLIDIANAEKIAYRKTEYVRILEELGESKSIRDEPVRKILYVGSSEPRSLRVRLEAADFEVVTADDKDQALRRAAQFSPQVILVESKQPSPSGHELWETLTRQPSIKTIPILHLVLSSQEANLQQRGVEGYVIKPSSDEAMKAMVRTVNKKYREFLHQRLENT